PDVDGELIGARERLRIPAGLPRERLDLFPRATVALRRVEVREPAVALRRRPAQHRVDVAADEDRRAWALHGPRAHDRLAQVELVLFHRHAVLGPEPREDVEVPLEETAALLEGHADGVELARVPAGRGAQDQPAARDHVERPERLGRDRRVAQWQHEDAGAELDARGAGGDGGENSHGIEDRERRLDAEDDVIPRPQRLEAERFGALRVTEDGGHVGSLGGPDEVLDRQSPVHLSRAPAGGSRPRPAPDRCPATRRSWAPRRGSGSWEAGCPA